MLVPEAWRVPGSRRCWSGCAALQVTGSTWAGSLRAAGSGGFLALCLVSCGAAQGIALELGRERQEAAQTTLVSWMGLLPPWNSFLRADCSPWHTQGSENG